MSDLRMPATNYIIIAGRLTRDADLKYLQSGMAVCKLSIANSRHYKDKSGEKKEDTSFVDVTCWDKTAEWAGGLKKGRPVLVEGRIKSESWEDKEGNKKSKLGIQAQSVTPMDWDEKGDKPEPRRESKPQQASYDEPIPEDDIPF